MLVSHNFGGLSNQTYLKCLLYYYYHISGAYHSFLSIRGTYESLFSAH